MTTKAFVLYRLEPQPLRFDAPVRISKLYQDAFGLVARSPARRSAVLKLIEVDINLLAAHDEESAIGLAVRAALQSCVDRDLLSLNIFAPPSGRFLRLPKYALISPFKFESGFLGADPQKPSQFVPANVEHVPIHSWVEGTLLFQETDASLDRIAREELPVFTTRRDAGAALKEIRLLLDGSETTNAADIETAKITIREEAAKNNGRLSLRLGADLLKHRHGIGREAAHELIRAVLGRQPPGRPTRN
jgi:hypothetical protein